MVSLIQQCLMNGFANSTIDIIKEQCLVNGFFANSTIDIIKEQCLMNDFADSTIDTIHSLSAEFVYMYCMSSASHVT